jgi:hypothetical protein
MSEVAKAAPARNVYKHARGYIVGVDIAGAAPDLMDRLSQLNDGLRVCKGYVIATPEHLPPDTRAKHSKDHTEPRANMDDGVVLMLVDTVDGLSKHFMRDECRVQLLYEEEQIVVSEPHPHGLKQYRWSEYLEGHEMALTLACAVHPCVKMTDLTRVLDGLGFQSSSLNRLHATTLELMSQHDTLIGFLPQWLRNLAIYVPSGVDVAEVYISTNDVRSMLAGVLDSYAGRRKLSERASPDAERKRHQARKQQLSVAITALVARDELIQRCDGKGKGQTIRLAR